MDDCYQKVVHYGEDVNGKQLWSKENVKYRRKRKCNCIKISVLWQIKTRSKPEHFVQI